ncbi:carbohydrate ABC transporter permease [candidate division KSB1 bacterium]|nr:carbohydrate ABC transporter permease [candidate division KSB1 bacterium]
MNQEQTIAIAKANPGFFQSRSKRKQLGRMFAYAALITFSSIFIIPFAWTLSASLKSLMEIYAIPHVWIPNPPLWQNYIEIFKKVPLHKFFGNTIIVTVLSVFGQVTSASLVGFAFARLRWPGRNFLFVVLLSTMMLPGQVTMIPIYLLFEKIGWINTWLPLIVPSYFGGGVFNIFLLRQFFKTIPLELEDAARIDGCSNFRIFWQIMVPLAKPAIATIAVLSFVGHWNDFISPLIYLHSYRLFPISLGINMFKGAYSIFPHYLMAASVVALVPILILFFFAQKYFVKGIILSGIKG